MKIVAFMQNMWVRDPARVYAAIEHFGEQYRRRAIYNFLFAGCLTGKRLRLALGGLCEKIVWEESTREITSRPDVIVTADRKHIESVLTEEKPDIVVFFGKIAHQGVWCCGYPVVRSPHPAVRSVALQQEFRDAMKTLIELSTK